MSKFNCILSFHRIHFIKLKSFQRRKCALRLISLSWWPRIHGQPIFEILLVLGRSGPWFLKFCWSDQQNRKSWTSPRYWKLLVPDKVGPWFHIFQSWSGPWFLGPDPIYWSVFRCWSEFPHPVDNIYSHSWTANTCWTVSCMNQIVWQTYDNIQFGQEWPLLYIFEYCTFTIMVKNCKLRK